MTQITEEILKQMNQMVVPWGAIISGAASLATAVIGNAKKKKDARQLRQQGLLNQLQMKDNMAMMDYSNEKQMEMWENTGYGAQKAQMKEAGINPALMYGMSGGGGQTVGSPGTGGISGAQAPSGSGMEDETRIGMGIQAASTVAQLSLLKAQTENIEADTALKNTNVGKINTVDIPNVQANTELALANRDLAVRGLENKRAEQAMTEAMTKSVEQGMAFKNATWDDSVAGVKAATDKAISEASIVFNEEQISAQTVKEKVSIIKANSAGAWLQNELTKEQTNLSKEQQTKVAREVNQIIQDNMRDWDAQGIQSVQQQIDKLLTEQGMDQKNIDMILKGIGIIGGMSLGLPRTEAGEEVIRTQRSKTGSTTTRQYNKTH